MRWTTPEGFEGCHVIEGKDCTIWLERRPGWCDRGNWLATLSVHAPLEQLRRDGLYIDDADGWPRYYFDLGRAKLEIEAWLARRGQVIDDRAGAVVRLATEEEQRDALRAHEATTPREGQVMKQDDIEQYEKAIAEARANWPIGPWTSEPDRIEWRCHGLPCLMVRSVVTGAWCGYAGVSPGHPYHGKDFDDVDLSAHGGLSYASKCSGSICHVPEAGESEDVYWFGFDCAHAYDDAPFFAHSFMRGPGPLKGRWGYKDVAYVKREVERLAEQLAAVIQ